VHTNAVSAALHHPRDARQPAGSAGRAADQRTAGGTRQYAAREGAAAPRRQQQQDTRAQNSEMLARNAGMPERRASIFLIASIFDPMVI